MMVEEKSSTYHHADKVGNKADVWKHFILFNIFKSWLSIRSNRKPIRYAETHSGQGIYSLGSVGAWQSGVGYIYESDLLGEDGYIDVQRTAYSDHQQYLGSWVLVQSILEKQQYPYQITLCDTNRHVMESIGEMELDRTKVALHVCDGYQYIENILGDLDFVFIDPPYVPDLVRERQACQQLIKKLDDAGVAWLLWYPIITSIDPWSLIDNKRTNVFDVRWLPDQGYPDPQMIGCGVFAADQLITIIDSLVPELNCLKRILEN